MMKKFLSFLLIAMLVLTLAGCGQKAPAPAANAPKEEPKAQTIRIAHTLAPESHYHKGLEKFASILEQKSGGKLKAQIFHSAQLGSERDAIEGVSMGTLEATLVSTAPLANFSKKFMVFDLPFIIQDRAVAFAAMDGEMGKGMLASLEAKGIKGLGFWENGFRMLTNSKKAINTPADIAGLKIRLMENPVHVETFKVLGAQPVPMPFGELFTSLQQKTVDGQENPLVIIYTSKFYEVQKHLALTGHFYAPAAFLVSKSFYDKLSPELQKALSEAEQEARKWEREYCINLEKDLVAKLKEKGMEVTTPDKKALQEATKSVYEKFKAEIGEDVINALLKK
ncbi:DctP family TRAP transporter solute-binding subunit [Thermanaerosceptrum fracticalcis]|uniref:DctP family TRAP transporter solute-binding subunit n=2 Tax=Thermanaerosceptrum fracticalcis TaxID=1712410 RepID=A0A7G6E767_THEFR|nr:DctP family TRAP transporter solute-binding subunit [Thermanaerosceptrum fracticalcis]